MYSHYETYLGFDLTNVDGTAVHIDYPTKTNTMPANALATLGTSASPGMILTPQSGIFRH